MSSSGDAHPVALAVGERAQRIEEGKPFGIVELNAAVKTGDVIQVARLQCRKDRFDGSVGRRAVRRDQVPSRREWDDVEDLLGCRG